MYRLNQTRFSTNKLEFIGPIFLSEPKLKGLEPCM